MKKKTINKINKLIDKRLIKLASKQSKENNEIEYPTTIVIKGFKK